MMTLAILWLLASDPTQVNGVLEYTPLEGGVWTIRSQGVVYDLHGDRQGLRAGETVLVKGRVSRNRVCIHQAGVVFQIESIARLKRPGNGRLTPLLHGIDSPSDEEVFP